MILSTLFDHPYTVFILISITSVVLILLTFLCAYLCVHQKRRKKQSNVAIAKKRLLYSSPTSLTPEMSSKGSNRFVFPLAKFENAEVSSLKIIREPLPQISISEVPSNYKTFDLAKRYQRHLSSDSSYTSSNHRRSLPPPSFSFETVKSKIQQVHRRSTPSPISTRPLATINSDQISITPGSDSDEQDNESLAAPSTPSFEYSLIELFRIELIYKLHYSIDDNQLLFQLVRLSSMQPLIERCFPSFICKIRLFTNNDKHKNKKYFSKKDPLNEIFKFDLNQYTLEQSYLKIHVLGHHKNDKRIGIRSYGSCTQSI